jgi:hypothetical protein
MKKKIVLLILFSVFLSCAMTVPSLSQWAVGVNVGDWFKYEGTLVLWEADPGVPFPPNEYALILKEYNETDWYNYTVTDIVGETVTFEILTHWSNGTETTSVLVDNMTSSFTMMVIGANLEPGTQIRDEFDWEPILNFSYVWPPRTLNEAIMVEYEAGTRETNVLDWVHPPTFGYTRQIYHWDKEYGIQVGYEVHSTATDFVSGGEYTYIAAFQLVDSSINVLAGPRDTTPPTIIDVSQNPLENNVQPEDEVTVEATVIDVTGGVEQVALNYTNGNGTWVIIEMTSVHQNVWSAIIPAFPYGTNVTYEIIAEDNMNNTITTEDLGYEYQYTVIPEFPIWTSILFIFTVLTVSIVIYKRILLKKTSACACA